MKEHAENCGFVLFKSVVPYVDTVILLDTRNEGLLQDCQCWQIM